MDVLVLGSGAREHALAWRLARDDGVGRLRIAPGNGGTPAVAETVPDLDILDPAAVARYAARERYDLVVIGPEAPLAAGVADALRQASVPTFGPSRAAARLESSKAFAKEQLRRAGVPTGASAVFDDLGAALAHARQSAEPLVVKADWLAAGKGVVVPDSHDAAEAAIRELLRNAPAGSRLLLEDRLSGREVSVFALVSDESVVPVGAACDHKRLLDGDEGPNTGGMGAYAPVPWFSQSQVEDAVATIFEPIAWRMARDGTPYRGVLYAGLMLTDAGPMVLEFNARFGDPEAQVLLPLMDGSLSQALLATATGDRAAMEGAVALDGRSAVGVVVAAEGYPSNPLSGSRLEGAEPTAVDDVGPLLRFHAGTQRAGDGGYRSSGGRVVTIVGIGDDLATARETAYLGVAEVRLEGGQYRSDIGLGEV
ncbi:MAG TPA: phosphoribosylamine--glycine ligase [Methylomirabilota bacterium]|nr:phosphoribosylamine--glycine ligase [Methylomirabilota bacterium]